MHQLQEGLADYILKNSNDGIYMFDRELRYSFWNPAMESITGYTQEECVGKEAGKLFPFLKKNGKTDIYSRVLEGEEVRLEDQAYHFPDKGKSGICSEKYLPFYDALGKISGGLAFIKKRSGSNATAQDLENTEQRYSLLVDQAPMAISVITADEILFVNHKTIALLGALSAEELIGKSPLDFIAFSSKQQAARDITDILSNKILDPVEHRLRMMDGKELMAEISYLPINYLGKRAIQLIMRDITREKNIFQELVTHKSMLAETQQMAGLGSYHVTINPQDLLQSNLFWTDGVYDILEIENDGSPLRLEAYFNLLENPVKEALYALIDQLRNKELPKVYHSHKVQLVNGKLKDMKLIGKPVFTDSGEMIALLGAIQDVSEQTKTEEELIHANHLLNLHFENSPIGIIQLDSKMKVSSWSKHAERIFGWESADVIGKNLMEWSFIHPDNQEEMISLSQKLRVGAINYKKGLVKLNTKKNTIVYCEFFLSCINKENGSLNSVFVLVNDVTMRQLAEKARSEGQQEERKRIARDIHDGIGQMLVASKYKLATLESLVEEENLHHIQALEEMLEQTLAEVRSVSKNLAPRSVATMGLESSLRQMCEQIKKLTALDLKFRYIGGEQEISHKTIHSLYRIAQEAVQNVVKHAQASDASIQVFQGRNFIELKVEDNGKGFVSESTSDGQGLKNMEERVSLLGGRFQIYSEVGNGTSLIINIPLEIHELEN